MKRREVITPIPNSPPVVLRAPGRVVAGALLLLVALAASDATRRAHGEASRVEPTRTAKERLGGKASDEQRVDNCKVPPALRGSKSRPDGCEDGVGAGSAR
jgi:hypothetical protein